MTLTKRDLVVRIGEETGKIQFEIHEIIQKTLDYIAEALARGDKVELRNFGVFYVRTRKPRVGRNPKRPDVDVPIPRLAVVKFKPGLLMKQAVAKLPPPPVKEARPVAKKKAVRRARKVAARPAEPTPPPVA
jgi:nucleoid DNA-binding protein